MTAARPPGTSKPGIAARAASSWPSSSLTAIRSAWKTRVAGSIGPCRARPGIARRTIAASCAGGPDRLLLPFFDDPAGDSPAESLFPQFEEQVRQIGLAQLIDQLGRRSDRFARVESHVERSVGREAETPVLPGELVR